jgi:hypothetical protein
LLFSINSLKLPQREYSGGICVRLIQPPLAYMKKSSCGFTDRSLFPGSKGGGFFSTGGFAVSSIALGEAPETGGGGFWEFGAAVALPKAFGFRDSFCALRLQALKSAISTRKNDFIARVRPLFCASVEHTRSPTSAFSIPAVANVSLQLFDFVAAFFQQLNDAVRAGKMQRTSDNGSWLAAF